MKELKAARQEDEEMEVEEPPESPGASDDEPAPKSARSPCSSGRRAASCASQTA